MGFLCQYRREVRAAKESSESLIPFSGKHGFTDWLA
jgi:hypothetical protein